MGGTLGKFSRRGVTFTTPLSYSFRLFGATQAVFGTAPPPSPLPSPAPLEDSFKSFRSAVSYFSVSISFHEEPLLTLQSMSARKSPNMVQNAHWTLTMNVNQTRHVPLASNAVLPYLMMKLVNCSA